MNGSQNGFPRCIYHLHAKNDDGSYHYSSTCISTRLCVVVSELFGLARGNKTRQDRTGQGDDNTNTGTQGYIMQLWNLLFPLYRAAESTFGTVDTLWTRFKRTLIVPVTSISHEAY